MNKELDYKFDVDLFLTKNCDQKCYYCTSFKCGGEVEVDVDYFKHVVEQLKGHPIFFTFVGGEPGLVTNLDVLIDETRKIDKQFELQVVSNSLVREKHPFILDDPTIIYKEHLLFDIDENGVHKFADYDFFELNNKQNYNVVIMTNNVVDHYEKYPKEIDELIAGQTDWKMINNRSKIDGIEGKILDYRMFHERVGLHHPTFNFTASDRKLCSLCPPSSVLNFETKKIHHCCMYPSESAEMDLTSDNIKKMLTFSLFDDVCPQKYCETCFSVLHSNKLKCMIYTKKTGISINR